MGGKEIEAIALSRESKVLLQRSQDRGLDV